jgi:TonB family protein
VRTLIHWAAKLYPRVWRDRYGLEFEALLDEARPSWRGLFNVVGGALGVRARALLEGRVPTSAPVGPTGFVNPFRPGVVITLIAQAIVFSSLAVASYFYVRPMPLNGPAPPSPPPAPQPPVEITDPRVFRGAPQVYSSLPLGSFAGDKSLFTQVVPGVGIYFFPLSDMGLIYPRRDTVRRVWPGQALESEILRRVIPKYPAGTRNETGVVSVSLEYVIGIDGSVRVLRSSGPALFDKAARAAVESWVYRPIRFEGHFIEVVSRVEVRFDAELAKGPG